MRWITDRQLQGEATMTDSTTNREEQRYFAVQAKNKKTGEWYTAHLYEDRDGYEIFCKLADADAFMDRWKRDCKHDQDLPDEFRIVELVMKE